MQRLPADLVSARPGPWQAWRHGCAARRLAERRERIAACWADRCKVMEVAFKPDWNHHCNAAPFKRNDTVLEALQIGIVAFPGSAISAT
jgi:hypothetical protein